MSPLSLLSTPSRPRSRDESSFLLITDDIYRHYFSIRSIHSLELRKEREEPAKHEFIILEMTDRDTRFRIERHPSEGTNITAKSKGCEAKDIITPLDDQDYESLCRLTDRKINLCFTSKTPPDLYTVFAFCNVILKDPAAKIYSLPQFNCYFFARTLTLLLARHFLLHQYCHRIHKSPKNFGHLLGPEIDAILDEVMKKMRTWERPISFILDDSSVRDPTYKDLRQYRLEMNRRHSKKVSKFWGKGDLVYKILENKMEEIWSRTMHSDES
ncbi:hypothetical protein F5887DRAFT_1078533 [Amanita rubescens]|nr:hypothetical protein F5887DRAFT_1078533 [Amanita rubescens]